MYTETIHAVADQVVQLPAVHGHRVAPEGAELRAVRREVVVVVEVAVVAFACVVLVWRAVVTPADPLPFGEPPRTLTRTTTATMAASRAPTIRTVVRPGERSAAR